MARWYSGGYFMTRNAALKAARDYRKAGYSVKIRHTSRGGVYYVDISPGD